LRRRAENGEHEEEKCETGEERVPEELKMERMKEMKMKIVSHFGKVLGASLSEKVREAEKLLSAL
jgi:hypothetical protein